jgi:hypothetical protein
MPCPLSDAGCTLRPSLRQASAVVPSPSRASRRMPDPAWRGWDSNPRSRAHEAREDGPSSTARGLAGWSRTSDLRCPKPAGWPLPYSQRYRARPWRRPEGRRPWNRTTLHRRIRAALSQPARRRCSWRRSELRQRGVPIVQTPKPAASRPGRCETTSPHGASPGNRTLLAGFTTRGLASSRATQSRREESNPRTPTVGAWCSPLSYGERDALDGNRTRLTRQTTGPHVPDASEGVLCAVPRAGIEPAPPV